MPEIDVIEVLPAGHIQVRQRIAITENGQELSYSFHRHVLSPGDDLSKQDKRVQAIATAVWTPLVLKAYQVQEAQRQVGKGSI